MTALARAWLACLVLTACESAAEKCKQARTAASAGWSVYVGILEKAKADANATHATVRKQLNSVVDPRLMPEAQKLADSRYDRSSGAWLLASKAAYSDLCSRDAECNDLRSKNTEATRLLEDVAERMPPALRARDATQAEPARAKTDAEAAIIDPERPQLKAAQQLSLELHERCKDVPAEATKEAP